MSKPISAESDAATPAMLEDTLLPFSFPAVERKKVTAAFDGGRMTSDGGVMLLAAVEKTLGIADRLAPLITDARNPLLVTHSVADILRARMLASPGALFQRAWSPLLGATHPEYPLLTSAFIARCWVYGGGATPESVPLITAVIFFLALCAIAVGGVARMRSEALGIVYGLILASTPALVHETTAQYADVPVACYFLGAVLFTAIGQPVLAGLFAGFAAWTKDEGLLFLDLVAGQGVCRDAH